MEDNTEDERINEQATSVSDNSPRGFRHRAKKAGKQVGKNLISAFRDGASKRFKFPKFKVILIISVVVVMIALFLIKNIIPYALEKALLEIRNFMNNIFSPLSQGSNSYPETGSLVLINDDQVSQLGNNYLETLYSSSKRDYELMQTKPSKLVKDNSGVSLEKGAISLSQDISIFEHVLNSERYNFNRIVWKEYDRNSNEAKEMKLKVDADTKLQYPDDSGKNLEYFLNIARPYLQSWVIPFSMMVGLSLDGVENEAAANFAYEIISNAYHKIEIEKRNLQSIDVFSEYKEYDETTYTVSITRTCTETTNEYEQYRRAKILECSEAEKISGLCEDNPSKGYKIIYVTGTRPVKTGSKVCTDSDPVITKVETNHIKENEKETSRKTYTNSVYNYRKIELFDKSIEFQINVTNYDLKSDPDRRNVEEEEYYEGESPTLPEIADDAGSGTYTTTYSVKEGTKYKVTKNWNDKIATSSVSRVYDINDIFDGETSDVTYLELTYYESLVNNKSLNLIDIINSSSDNYSRYVFNNNYSENIGYSRGKLKYSYELLKSAMQSLSKDNVSFTYGESLGINVKYTGSLVNFSLDVVQNINTNATYVAPIQDKAAIVSANQVATNVYGYAGHTGIDIIYPYALSDKSKCTDYPNVSRCPYNVGPPVYSVQDGILDAVAYSPYNKYYKTGTANYKDEGNLTGGGAQGSYVKIKHISSNGVVTYSAYWHLAPDYEHLKELSEKVGQTIPAGTWIGYMGNTGYSSGLHLHFEYAKVLFRIGNGATSLAILRLAGM